jgi:hypothetical protein
VRRNDAALELDRLTALRGRRSQRPTRAKPSGASFRRTDKEDTQQMIRIAITAAAYAAIRESLPAAGSRRYAAQKAVDGLYFVWVPNDTMDKLMALRRSSESYSDVIIRLASMET